ncbi:MAG: hypothetical protein IPM74_04315 [Crocinitomicaceae bacterium]|nr:hypothetical protein [Crocinitomicaceae bacterium]MBK8925133.1 hypothetical protein [Crocinitomicaceae bacterium]
MNTAEDIIRKKKFFELTATERELVKDYATNEEDYEAMRWFLLSTSSAFDQEKITPSENLKKGVMAHLSQKQAAPKGIWLNGVSAFLFPADKKIYQYPALQIAAVAILFIGAVTLFNQSEIQEKDLALNDHPVENPIKVDDEKTIISDPSNAQQDELQNGLNRNEQTGVTTTKTNTEGSELVMDELEETPVEDSYRDMSVAEEVKLSPGNAYDGPVLADDYNLSPTTTSNTGSGSTVTQTYSGEIGVDRKVNLSEKEKDKKTDKNSGYTNNNSGKVEEKESVSPAYSTTATDDQPEDGNLYKTSTAGGVFGDTSLDSADTEKADADENAATKYSVSDTKTLKKLYFTIK